MLRDHILSAMQWTEQADDELKAATAMFDEGVPDAADRLTATVDEHELAWTIRRMAEKEHLGYH